jgi:predicted dehydrogenase
MDCNEQRLNMFSKYYKIQHYRTLEDVLADNRVEMILNLTNPESHFQISKAALNAGKHVYSEKPLSMSVEEAQQLVWLAERKGLLISCAPSRILGETAQTMWKALRENAVGKVRLVYAEMDDGLVHRMAYRKWLSEAGAPWPYKNEFQTGCTLEHAGYALSWLAAFFGPARSITAFGSCQIPDKSPDVSEDSVGPDFTVAGIKFASGVAARLTCSLVAPADHSLRIFGDDGILTARDCWKDRGKVYLQKRINVLGRSKLMPWRKSCPLLPNPRPRGRDPRFSVDFCLGVTEMVDAIVQNRVCRLSPAYCLHVTEMVLAIDNAANAAMPYAMKTTFEPVEPMPWSLASVKTEKCREVSLTSLKPIKSLLRCGGRQNPILCFKALPDFPAKRRYSKSRL